MTAVGRRLLSRRAMREYASAIIRRIKLGTPIEQMRALAESGDYRLAELVFRRNRERIPADEARRQIAAINADILHTRGLEWTSHGIRRSFRLWSHDEKRQYLADCAALIETLKRFSQHVCLGFGAVLGIVREGGLIPHDDDCDIIVSLPAGDAPHVSTALAAAADYLTASGYTFRTLDTHHQVLTPVSHKIDVFVGLECPPHVSWHPGPKRTILLDDVFPPTLRVIYGVEVPIPRQPEIYLEHVYGGDWQTPAVLWRHAW